MKKKELEQRVKELEKRIEELEEERLIDARSITFIPWIPIDYPKPYTIPYDPNTSSRPWWEPPYIITCGS